MKIYGSFTSPYVRHCRIVLNEAQESYEFIETDNTSSAQKSPTKRVPFLEDGDLRLTDSSAIIKYIREKNGTLFLPGVKDYNDYCMVNTVLDSTTNLFFLKRDGVDAEAYEYTRRQAARIQSGLAELDQLTFPSKAPYNDTQLRLACYLAWGLFRQQISLAHFKNLQTFLNNIHEYKFFAETAPPNQ